MCVQSVYECSFGQALSTSRNDDNRVETKGTNIDRCQYFRGRHV